MSSKFSIKTGVQPTPKICKAVGDSFRFQAVPFNNVFSWSLRGRVDVPSFGTWEVNGSSQAIEEIPNQEWRGAIGSAAGSAADLFLEYDAFLAKVFLQVSLRFDDSPFLVLFTVIDQVPPDEPFSMYELELYSNPPNDYVRVRVLY